MGLKIGEYLLGVVFIALCVYVGGLLLFFQFVPGGKQDALPSNTISSNTFIDPNSAVLGIQEEAEAAFTKELPKEHKIIITPRKQQFNLSCEFAAAAAIVYHYTGEKRFSVENAENAEKILMALIGTSDNPNLGIRMGKNASTSAEQLYSNLNQQFGGEDYYGVHAPPFIDMFATYNLKARAISKDGDTIAAIQEALYNGHLIMTWLKIGYGGKVDASFTYGNIPIIKGEHAVVIHGYDQKGVFIMDNGNGSLKHLEYQKLFNATSFFSMPFLEVYLSTDTKPTLEETIALEKTTGLLRGNITIIVENASGEVGRGSQLADILRDFGYVVTDIRNASVQKEGGVSIQIMPEYKDYLYLLKKDLLLSQYDVETMSTDLSASASAGVVIVVGD